MLTFYRAQNTQLWLTLTSNEILGVLDSGYIEDYFGVDGQVTIRNVGTGERFVVLMNEVSGDVPHETFRGFIPTSILSDGRYQLEGRVRDRLNNYTILSEVENPLGSERVLPIEFFVYEGQPIFITLQGVLSLRMGFSLRTSFLTQETINVNTTPAEVSVISAMPEVFSGRVNLATTYTTQTTMKREGSNG